MFWWIVLAVVVVGFALAWWTSGRAKGLAGRDLDRNNVAGDASTKAGPLTPGSSGIPNGKL